MQFDFPYEVFMDRGLAIVFTVVLLAEMLLCLFTALQLRHLEPSGCKLNKVLLCFVTPLSVFFTGAVWFRPVIGIMAAVAVGLCFSLPVLTYYQKREALFKTENADPQK